MESIVIRKQASFRLSSDLIERLKVEAKKTNRSLNNFVESALMDLVYNKPNAETLIAIKEAQANKDLRNVDMSNFDSFLKSCSE